MDAEGLRQANRLLDDIKALKDTIYRLSEYLGKTVRMGNEPKNYYLRAKRTLNFGTEAGGLGGRTPDISGHAGRNYAVAIGEVTARQGELLLQNLTDADLWALKKALEERLADTRKLFEDI